MSKQRAKGTGQGLGGGRPRAKLEDRIPIFWSRVDRSGECWEWTGCRKAEGYGQFSVGRQHWAAHRFAYHVTNGPIPEGLVVRHQCDNPPCVRPEHLILGTHLQNAMDMVERGRARGARGRSNWNYRLSDEVIRGIRRSVANGMKLKDVANIYGVSPAYAGQVARRIWRKDVA